MLLQTDGRRHDWLESRGPRWTLIGMIDDANNEVVGASFREEEDAAGYFLVLQQVCLSKGLPQALYADRHTIFQSPKEPTVEQELSGELPRSQFGRLVDELGIQLIAARSPQAKDYDSYCTSFVPTGNISATGYWRRVDSFRP